jgi:HK97 family phage prohead protease
MPLPHPHDDEEHDEFIGRCLADPGMRGEFPRADQRVAVCERQWKDQGGGKTMHSDLTGVRITRIKKRAQGVTVTGDRTVRFVLSTGTVDRDNDEIDPRGWDLSDYSGIVLFGHDHQKPVARGRAWVEGDRLLGEATFPPEGASAFADEVFNLIKVGILTDCSVGFTPVGSPEPNRHGGWRFPGARLLEFSIVSIGSNRDARVLARELAEPELLVLKRWTGGDSLIITRETADAVRRALAEPRRELLPFEMVKVLKAEMGPWALRILAEAALSETVGQPGVWIPRAQAEQIFKMTRGRASGSRTSPAPAPQRFTVSGSTAAAVRREASGEALQVFDRGGRELSGAEVATTIRESIEREAREAVKVMNMRLYGIVD